MDEVAIKDMLIYKSCKWDFNQTDHVCDNLLTPENEAINEEVQNEVGVEQYARTYVYVCQMARHNQLKFVFRSMHSFKCTRTSSPRSCPWLWRSTLARGATSSAASTSSTCPAAPASCRRPSPSSTLSSSPGGKSTSCSCPFLRLSQEASSATRPPSAPSWRTSRARSSSPCAWPSSHWPSSLLGQWAREWVRS